MFVIESPGCVDVVVRTWRPQGDLRSKMREQFLGTSVRLKDNSFAEVRNCYVLSYYTSHHIVVMYDCLLYCTIEYNALQRSVQ